MRYNIKVFVITFVVGFIVLFTANQALSAPTVDECEFQGTKVVIPMATLRDSGVSPDAAFQILMTAGFPPSSAMAVVRYIYVVHIELSPERLYTQFMNDCLGEES